MMTPLQAEIILAYAENDMDAVATGRQLHRSMNDIHYHLNKIRNILGWNPRKFYDLCYLVGIAHMRVGVDRNKCHVKN